MREAERELAKFVKSIDSGGTYFANKLSLNDFINQWLETYEKSNLSPPTYQSYKKIRYAYSTLFMW